MKARDVMIFPVVTVRKGATVRDVARTLLDKHISAVPVIDSAGKVIGIVSEGDLMHRTETGTERPYSWWLHFMAGDATVAADYVKSHATKVEDVMTSEVVTAAPETPLHEIATKFEEHRIKRVPIVSKDGALVGIVSRANLIQVIASARPKLEMTLPESTIKQKLLDEIKKQPWAHRYNLSVTVAGGVVDLWGYAQSDDERRALRVAAEAIPGVVLVNDHLADSPVFAY